MRFRKFLLAGVCLTALGGPAAAESILMEGDYIRTAISDNGTLGWGSATPPGLQHDPTGTRDFGISDYLTPGTPWEIFSVSSDQTGRLTNNNTSPTSGPMVGTLSTASDSSFDHYVRWEGERDGYFQIVHEYYFNDNQERINIRTRLIPLRDLTNVTFLRAIDPDPDVRTHGDYNTTNQRGTDAVSGTNLVSSQGTSTGLILGLFSRAAITHNTGVSAPWSTDPLVYLGGVDDGDGDFAIGIAFDLGDLATGEEIAWIYAYVMALNIDSIGSELPPPSFTEIHLPPHHEPMVGALTGLVESIPFVSALFDSLPTPEAIVAAIEELRPRGLSTMPGGIIRAASNTVLSGRLSRVAPPGLGGGRPGGRSFALAPGVTMDINPQAFRHFAGGRAGSAAWMDEIARNVLAAAESLPAAGMQADPVDRPFVVFVEGVFDAGDIEATATQAGSDYFSRTVAVGGEYYLTRNFRLGVAFGGTSLDAGTDDASVSSENKSFFVAHYGSYNPLADFYLDYTLGYQSDGVKYTRNIGAPFNASTRADFDSTQLSASLRASYLFDLGWGRVQPYDDLTWLRVKTDAYQENGAGALDLAINEQASRALTNKLGIEASRQYRTDTMVLTPTLRAAWVHEFESDPRLITAQFAGAPNAPFTIATDASDANYFEAGLQVGAELAGGTTLTFGYDTVFGHEQLTNHRVMGNLRYRF